MLQNIEVIYAPISPSPSPSPSQSPPSDLLPPPAPPPVLTPSPKKTPSKKTIAIPVGVTAFCTLLLAAFLFFLATKYEEDKKKKEAVMVASRDGGDGGEGGGGLPPVVVQTRNDGKGKGLMIEEESQSKSGSFHRELIRRFSRGNSSSFMNQNQIHPKDDQELVLLDLNLSSSDHVSHNSDSPPPPPPPPHVVAYAAPPPPPPPMSGKKGPAPPPPPPKGGGASGLPRPPPPVRVSAIGEDEENVDQVKLKPLHWEKVNVMDKAHSMVWDKLQGGSFQYSVDMMEALFGTVATNRRPPTETSENKTASNSATKIFILDSRRSQNFAIVIKSLGISRSELIDGLLEGKGLNPETLEKLTRLSLTTEEKSQILAFNGDVGRLADAESFLYQLLKAVPSAFTRVNAIHFRYTFDSEIDQLKNMLQTLDSGCNELRERGLFLKLLEAILKSGNKLNAGTARGNAKAFNLTSLRKLSDYKSSDGKTTLLHFVVNEVVRNEGRRRVLNSNEIESKPKSKDEEEQEFLKLGLPIVSGLSLKLLDVMKSANIDYDTLSNISTSLETRVNKTRQLVLGIDGEEDEFTKEMKEFLEAAEVEVNAVKEEQIRVMEHVKKTTHYYQSGTYKEKQPLLLFAIVKDFLGMVDKACNEIARSLQQKKGNSDAGGSSKSQVSSSADVLRTRVTFPQMSESFMSVNSTASDSDAPAPPPPPVAAYNAGPPPPPPPMSIKKGPAPPPPPPAPMSGKKCPAPPPPPPKGGGGSGLPGLLPPVKLKPLHWEKANVVNKAHSMVWDKLQGGSFQYSVDTMESLFGTTATNRKPTETSENKTASNPTAKISILDSRRSQNFAIVIKSLGISRTDLIDGLIKGKGLNPETLEKLTRLSPTTEEKSQILAFNGDVGRLADAESFLYHLLKAVPSAFTRVNSIHFRYTFDSEIDQLKNMLQTLDLGCNELRERGLLLKLLEAILKSGNKLNAGTARGNAKAFNLTSLRKLSDYKSSDGKTTLLHFVVNEVVRNEGRRRVLNSTEIELKPNSKEEEEKEFLKLGLPIVSELSSKFLNVMKSANIDYDTLSNIGTSLETRVTKTRQLLLGIDGEEDEFTKEMKEFLQAAEVEVNAVKEEQIRVMESVKKTTQYYESGTSKEKQPLLLFAIVKDFLGMVDKACAEIARSLQQKKGNSDTPSSSKLQVSSSANVLRTPVTFPQMSDSFMSVNSTASEPGDEW